MKILTQKTVTLATLSAGVLISSFAVAAVSNVANTKHNFSVGHGYQYASTQVSEVCVFCHTPHNAGSTRLLWNKANNSVPNFRLYTSSGTLTTTVKKTSSLSANSPSLLCLGCHDGKTAMNVMHNSPVSGPSAAGAGYPAGSQWVATAAGASTPVVMNALGTYDFFSGTYGPSMSIGMGAASGDTTSGTNLTDDHPIGFSYSAVLSESSTGLNSIATVNTKSGSSVRFFGTSQKVECSTCHDPHVDYSVSGNPLLKPFLVMSNAQSALCLACHNK